MYKIFINIKIIIGFLLKIIECVIVNNDSIHLSFICLNLLNDG